MTEYFLPGYNSAQKSNLTELLATPKHQDMIGKSTFTTLVTLIFFIFFSSFSSATFLNPEVVEGNPKGKRNVDWIPAFQIIEIRPQNPLRRGDHLLRYYIGALSKDGKFYRPRADVQVAEIYLSSDPAVTSLLSPGAVFVYPERIFRFGVQGSTNPDPSFRIGRPIARLAANDAELNLVSLSDSRDIFLPAEVRRFSQLPRDQAGNPILWAKDRIGFSRSSIGRYGCVLATLAMMLDYLGINYNGEMDPGILNDKLKAAYTNMNISAFSAGDRLVLDRAVEAASGGKARFISLNEETDARNKFAILDRELSQGRPVMVTVPSTATRGGEHYVLVYARDDGEYLIKDPGYENRTKLSHYSHFTPRGVIVPTNPNARLAQRDNQPRQKGQSL
jgi:hypothetical protein